MALKDSIFSGKVQEKKAIFDFGESYRVTYEWIVNEGYELHEKKYSEKVNPNGKEIDIEWEAEQKITDYFKFVLKVQWKIIGMNDVEAEQNGTKMKLQKGDFEIRVKAVLVRDHESRWDKSPFLQWLRELYDKYIIKSRVDYYEEKIFGDADEFLAEVKAFLALQGEH